MKANRNEKAIGSLLATRAKVHDLLRARITLLQARVREEECFIALIDETVAKYGKSVALGLLRDDLGARVDLIGVEIEELEAKLKRGMM